MCYVNTYTLKNQSSRGFTLVELLVSSSVMTIMLIAVFQMTNQTTESILRSDKKSQNGLTANTVLNRMAYDIDKAILDGGSTMLVYNQESSPSSGLAFLSTGRAPITGSSKNLEDKSHNPLIIYRALPVSYFAEDYKLATENAKDAYLLCRGSSRSTASNVLTDSSSHLPGDFNLMVQNLQNTSNASNIDDWQPMGLGIVAFDVQCIQSDGTLTRDPASYVMPSPTNFKDSPFLGGTVSLPGAITALATRENQTQSSYTIGLHITIATLNKSTLNLLISTSQAHLLDEALPKVTGRKKAYKEWKNSIEEIDFLPLKQNLTLAQRTIYLR